MLSNAESGRSKHGLQMLQVLTLQTGRLAYHSDPKPLSIQPPRQQLHPCRGCCRPNLHKTRTALFAGQWPTETMPFCWLPCHLNALNAWTLDIVSAQDLPALGRQMACGLKILLTWFHKTLPVNRGLNNKHNPRVRINVMKINDNYN